MRWRYRVKWDKIPEHMREELASYIEMGRRPGGFLRSIVSNNLRGAAVYADDVNRHLLFDYVMWITSFAPPGSWGSDERYEAWIKAGGIEGMEKAARQEQDDDNGTQVD